MKVITMLLNTVLFAASAAALLVAPTIEKGDDVVKALPVDPKTFEVLPMAFGESIQVPCAECAGQDPQVMLDFAIEDSTRLTVNGFELYPNADPWRGDLSAFVATTNSRQKQQKLGYSLAVTPGPVDEEHRMELIDVELQIFEVGGHFVGDVPVVHLKLIKEGSDMIIAKVDLKEGGEKPCTTFWCQLKDRLKHSLKKVKGCGGHGRPHHNKHGKQQKHHGEHRPHGKGFHRHDWKKLLKNVAANILLPVLMGLTAGVGVAVFSMGLCSCLALFIKSRRSKCKRRCQRAKANITEPAIEEEKTGLMDDQPAPPQYEEGQAK